jgi:S-adenosylmethionine synthetase
MSKGEIVMKNPRVILERLDAIPVSKHKVEIVERKGMGHPDHIIDSCSQPVSRALSEYYMEHFGRILHHNVDKGLLVGGHSQWKFGGGTVDTPIEIIIAGRASDSVKMGDRTINIPVNEIAHKAIISELNKLLRFLDTNNHVKIYTKIRPGSQELIGTFERGLYDIPLANDTSFGVAFAPFTDAERIALGIEQYLNSSEYKRKRPYVGEDIKVMILRIEDQFDITVAAAFIDKFFMSTSEYVSAKEDVYNDILDYIAKSELNKSVDLKLNVADDPENDQIYLTVTGTSAESGDDGNTGRSNRVYGLITPNRQMSLEAVAGKNPVSHVGKIYNVLAYRISKRIYDALDGIEEVYARILSRIREPIDSPQIINIQVISNKNVDGVMRSKIDEIIQDELSEDRLRELTSEILARKYILF